LKSFRSLRLCCPCQWHVPFCRFSFISFFKEKSFLCHCDCSICYCNVYDWVARLCSPWLKEVLHWIYIDIIFSPLLLQCIKKILWHCIIPLMFTEITLQSLLECIRCEDVSYHSEHRGTFVISDGTKLS